MDTGFIFVAMVAFVAVMVWAFFTFGPDFADKKTVSVFNYTILGVIGMLCIAVSFKAYVYLSGSDYDYFMPTFMFFLNMSVIAVGLLVGLVIRNFIIFK